MDGAKGQSFISTDMLRYAWQLSGDTTMEFEVTSARELEERIAVLHDQAKKLRAVCRTSAAAGVRVQIDGIDDPAKAVEDLDAEVKRLRPVLAALRRYEAACDADAEGK